MWFRITALAFMLAPMMIGFAVIAWLGQQVQSRLPSLVLAGLAIAGLLSAAFITVIGAIALRLTDDRRRSVSSPANRERLPC